MSQEPSQSEWAPDEPGLGIRLLGVAAWSAASVAFWWYLVPGLFGANSILGLIVAAAATVSYARGVSERSFLIGAGVVLVSALPLTAALAIYLTVMGPVVVLVLAVGAWLTWTDTLPVRSRRTKVVLLACSAVLVGAWWTSAVGINLVGG